MDNSENYRYAVSKRNFNYNCGIDEHYFNSFRNHITATPSAIIKYFNWYFSSDGGGNRGAALVFTDNLDEGDMHKALSEVAQKVCLGRNSNSGNRIYMWILSRQSIENYERKKANKKKKITTNSGKKVGKKGR